MSLERGTEEKWPADSEVSGAKDEKAGAEGTT